MDLKVNLDATSKSMEKLTMKHVNWRRLCDILCNSIRRNSSRCTALRIKEKYLTRRDNVNHVVQGH